MKDQLILISGKKQHGKNQIAEHMRTILRESWELNSFFAFTEESFAKPLKKIANEVFRLDYRQVFGDLKEVKDMNWGMTPREIMQKIGTEFGRAIHPDVWALSLALRIRDDAESMTRQDETVAFWFVTDTRFPNEIVIPKGILGNTMDVRTVRIVRPGLPPTDFDSHVSETSLDNWTSWDAVIQNDGGIDDLLAKTQDLFYDWYKIPKRLIY